MGSSTQQMQVIVLNLSPLLPLIGRALDFEISSWQDFLFLMFNVHIYILYMYMLYVYVYVMCICVLSFCCFLMWGVILQELDEFYKKRDAEMKALEAAGTQ